ncbi:hypothetical protein [Caedibacter taeniospiralis]|uniref:hypothetical protein n=1 Tax=Caedibacter taeniospiralis TaxID=28907 RepID=UPI000C27000B|nr:hypothetical protein [Caedibacter taeniospiralis]
MSSSTKSSIFEGLSAVEEVSALSPPVGIFEGLTPIDDNSDNQIDHEQKKRDVFKQVNSDSFWINFSKQVLREGVKPALKGLAAIPDFAVALGNLGIAGINKITDAGIAEGKMPSELVGQGVDFISGGLSEGDAGILGKGIEFGTGMLAGGIAAKVLKEGSKVAPYLGSTKPTDVGIAAGIGATTQAAEALGADPLTATGVGLSAGLTPVALPKIAHSINSIGGERTVKAISKLNQGTKAALREDIPIPRFVSSDSKVVDAISTSASKLPVAGDKMRQSIEATNEALLSKRHAIAESIGHKVDVELTAEGVEPVLNRQKALYEEAAKHIRQGQTIKPDKTLKALEEVDAELTKVAKKSPETASIQKIVTDLKEAYSNGSELSRLQSSLEKSGIRSGTKAYEQALKESGFFSTSSTSSMAIPVEVDSLIAQKQELYDQIYRKGEQSLSNTSKARLKKITSSLRADIDDYALTNEAFKKPFDAANKLHGEIKRREIFDKFLDPHAIGTKEAFNYATFKKQINKALTNQEFVKIIGPDNANTLKNLGAIAHQFTVKSRNSLNPSGTAATQSLFTAAKVATEHIVSLRWGEAIKSSASSAAAIALGQLYAKPITREKLMRYLKNPTPEHAKMLDNTVKAQLSMNIQQLMAEIAENAENGRREENQ